MQCPSNSQILASRPESRKNRTTIKTNWKIEHVKNNKQNKCFLSFLVFSICFSCCFCFSTFRCRPPPCQCILPVIRSWPAGQNVEQNTENQETENNGNIENVKITNKTHACFTFYIFNCFYCVYVCSKFWPAGQDLRTRIVLWLYNVDTGSEPNRFATFGEWGLQSRVWTFNSSCFQLKIGICNASRAHLDLNTNRWYASSN